ncbi:MAG: RsmB/NOP family class I SAM-dependent RNA methyltransferase [Desulfurococcales archaeon]|nr:RsmB/NOP family class I SAM-dependent RNA methyltransferase [Desulfurococcales archaeon]
MGGPIISLKIRPSREARRLAERYGYLAYMVERYIELLGVEETKELLEANEEPLPETIRCNDYIIDCRELAHRLEAKGFELKPLHLAPHGLVVARQPISIGATLEYLQGFYYIQDPASMLVAYEIEPRPRETVLDMAAAPGGKATQILQLSRDQVFLVAVDISRRRMRSLRSNINRMRFRNYILIRGDSRKLNLHRTVDKVLLDAPSSGEGIIRKDPTRKRSRSLEDILSLSALQADMLSAAVNYVKEGGVIVYSACTLAPEEGEAVISYVLERHPDVEVVPLSIPHSPGVDEYFGVKFNGSVRKCGRLYPHIHGTEGFFICKLIKRP